MKCGCHLSSLLIVAFMCFMIQIEAAKGFLSVLRSYLDSLCSNMRSHTITNVQSNNDKVCLVELEYFSKAALFGCSFGSQTNLSCCRIAFVLHYISRLFTIALDLSIINIAVTQIQFQVCVRGICDPQGHKNVKTILGFVGQMLPTY